MHLSKAKQGIHPPLPIGRQVPSHLQESRAPSGVTVVWEDKRHHSQLPPLPPSSLSFTDEHDVLWCGISLWSAGVSCPGCVHSQLLLHPQPTHWWSTVRSRKGLHAVQTLLSSSTNIPRLATLFAAQTQSTASY